MSSLTDAAFFSKKAFIWIILGISFVVALLVFLGIFKNIKNAIFPPAPLPATVSFGKLPKIDLKDGFSAKAGVLYDLQTISGGFENLGDSAKVFSLGYEASSFGTTEKMLQRARAIEFENTPEEISTGVYKFVDTKDPSRKLTIDSISGNFTMESDYINNQEIIASHPNDEKGALDAAFDFFENYGISLSDYPEDKIVTKKMRIDGTKLSEVNSLASANLVRVDFLRQDLDNVPVYWHKDGEAGISALVWGRKVVFAKANPAPILKQKFASYPLRGADLAFEDLKNGLGFFNKDVNLKQITILKVSLGYVESANAGDFLQPIYVFEGVDGLKAYVAAVDEKWLQ